VDLNYFFGPPCHPVDTNVCGLGRSVYGIGKSTVRRDLEGVASVMDLPTPLILSSLGKKYMIGQSSLINIHVKACNFLVSAYSNLIVHF